MTCSPAPEIVSVTNLSQNRDLGFPDVFFLCENTEYVQLILGAWLSKIRIGTYLCIAGHQRSYETEKVMRTEYVRLNR